MEFPKCLSFAKVLSLLTWAQVLWTDSSLSCRGSQPLSLELETGLKKLWLILFQNSQILSLNCSQFYFYQFYSVRSVFWHLQGSSPHDRSHPELKPHLIYTLTENINLQKLVQTCQLHFKHVLQKITFKIGMAAKVVTKWARAGMMWAKWLTMK